MGTNLKIRPIPEKQGWGFFSFEELPENVVHGYRFEKVGRYFNYHFTPSCHTWPSPGVLPPKKPILIDGFSPNLNKPLHVGHLRNMVLANAFLHFVPKAELVSLYGAAIAESEVCVALEAICKWRLFLGWEFNTYWDSTLLSDVETLPKGQRYREHGRGYSDPHQLPAGLRKPFEHAGPVVLSHKDP